MNRIVCMSLMAVFLVLGPAWADEQRAAGKDEGVMNWLKSLQRKIETLAPKKTMSMGTGVAGIRGAKEDEKARLYWKGKKGEEAVTDEELIKFKSAIDLAQSGETAAAAHELEAFLARFPASPLVPDVKKTLAMMKTEEGEKAPAQEPKHE